MCSEYQSWAVYGSGVCFVQRCELVWMQIVFWQEIWCTLSQYNLLGHWILIFYLFQDLWRIWGKDNLISGCIFLSHLHQDTWHHAEKLDGEYLKLERSSKCNLIYLSCNNNLSFFTAYYFHWFSHFDAFAQIWKMLTLLPWSIMGKERKDYFHLQIWCASISRSICRSIVVQVRYTKEEAVVGSIPFWFWSSHGNCQQ